MIQLENLSFHYPGTKTESLCGIDLSIAQGECVLITGKSGCGKTTLTRILNGLCPKFYGGALTGNYHLDGRNVNDMRLDEIGQTLGSVFQDPRSQFFAKYVRDELVLAMENHCVPRHIMQTRLAEVCHLLDISHLLGHTMANLSSGEKQKVAIASVFAIRPGGMVLDEPSANLDEASSLQLAMFLGKLKEQGHAIIISEHRIHYLQNVFDRLVVMQEGKIIRQYTREEALSLSPAELTAMGLRQLSISRPNIGARIAEDRACAIQGENISFRASSNQILSSVTVGLAPGEIVAVTGSNGAGKSTLCKIISGITKESSGAIWIHGTVARRKTRIRNSFLVQQDVDYQLYTPSVQEEILLGTKRSADEQFFLDLTSDFGLDTLLTRHPNTLSGGQKQRVLLAAAALRNVALIVLDEPTSGLDGYHMRITAQRLQTLAKSGKTILLVTHDIEFINLVATSIVFLQEGAVKYHSAVKR